MRSPKLMRRLLPAMLVVGALVAVVVPAASAHVGNATIACAGVTFNYTSGFPDPTNTVQEYVYIDGSQVAQASYTFSGAGGPGDSNTVAISVPAGTHTVTADAYSSEGEVVGFPVSATVSGCTSGPCQTASAANFRWHYSANGSSGSWSGTKTQTCGSSFSMGPQAMEGDLKLAPGTTMLAGYDFTVPGNKSSLFFTVSNAQVVFSLKCVSGATPSPSTLTVTMPTQTYNVTNDQWYPSGDQHNPLVYQGSATVPYACGTNPSTDTVRFNQGGTFSATLS
jgi:hypothetical protein